MTAGLYAAEAVPRRLNVTDTLKGKLALRQRIEDLPPLSRETGTRDETVRDRLRMLAAIDEGTGMLFAALEEQGQLDDTAIIFISDHGYWYGEHGLSVERRLAYEEALRIPLLVRYPRLIKGGRTVDEFALSIDLAPTVLELAQINAQSRHDGHSLIPLFRGDAPKDWRTSFLVEYNTDIVFPRVRNMGYKAVRTKRWKYIRYNELDGMDELYDLKNDPYELCNLMGNLKSQSELKELTAELELLCN